MIFVYLNLFSKFWGLVTGISTTIGFTVNLTWLSLFLFLVIWQSPRLYQSFHYLSFSFAILSASKSALLLLLFYFLRVFLHEYIVWVTASLFKSLGLSSIFLQLSRICTFDSLHSSSYLQVFQSHYQSFGVFIKLPNYGIDISITFMFHSFYGSLARFTYLSLISLSFSFTVWSCTMANLGKYIISS